MLHLNRRDRDNYVTINWNNIGQYRDQFQVQLGTLISPCPYDYLSVMHYGPYVRLFNSNQNYARFSHKNLRK